MIRRPPRSTLDRSSAASDVYKRQPTDTADDVAAHPEDTKAGATDEAKDSDDGGNGAPVSYTHLRAHETVLDLVCRLLLEKKKNTT